MVLAFGFFNFYNLYISEFEIYIVDKDNSVIISNIASDANSEYVDTSNQELKEHKDVNFKQTPSGRYYVHHVNFKNTPFELFAVIPISKFLFCFAVYSIPIVMLCIFLLIALREINRRKEIECKLRKSLEESTQCQLLLENAAKYDFITNTVNRRGLKDKFDQAIESGCTNLSFIMGDIDYFKEFNDKYGHNIGDRVLIRMSDVMKSFINEKDAVVCRWGGEEFVIMLFDTPYNEALKFAEKLRKEIEDMSIQTKEYGLIKSTITFGVSDYLPEDNKIIENCISRADKALYTGKNRGKNIVVGYLDICKE